MGSVWRVGLITIGSVALCAVAILTDRTMQFFLERDAGVFLYIARRIQAGDIPYRDIWDHKPPLIYYIDVVGLTLTDLGLPGISVLEFAALVAAAVVGGLAMARALGVLPAIFGSTAWIMTLPLLLSGGNLSEEFALPLQFVALALYLSSQREAQRAWPWIAIGVAGGLALMLKPTVLGIWAAIYLYEAGRAWRRRWWSRALTPLVYGTLGGVVVLLPVVAYFVLSGAGDALFDQLVRYNAEYSKATTAERIAALAYGLILTTRSTLLPIAIAGWGLALRRIVRGTGDVGAQPLLGVAVIALPIEFALASAPGRLYHQYFIACLPTLGLLAAITAYVLWPRVLLTATRRQLVRQGLVGGFVVLAAIAFGSAASSLAESRQQHGPDKEQLSRQAATTFVLEHTQSSDRVLFWGGEAGLNYTTARRSPTRFAYQYALYVRGYQDPSHVDEMLSDLVGDPPAMIVDASNDPAKILPSLNASERETWMPTNARYAALPAIDRFFRWVEEHYVPDQEIGPLRWRVYVRRGS